MCPKLRVLWIVHSWLLLQSRVPNVESALDCTFLIVPSVFSNVYFSVPLDCPFLIAPSISCAQGWQCSGLSILDCSFNIVCPKLTVLWIVHSWLLLQSRVSKVDSVSGLSILDCSFNLECPRLTVLWIVHSWLLLQCRVPKVDSALDCTFLIVPSVFSNVYFSVSLDCPFLIAPSISCAQGWQCSGLSILDCSFNLVCPKLTVLWIVHSWLSSLRFSLTFTCQWFWIVHSWLLLQTRVPKVDSALDCPFLIVVPSIFSNVYLSVSLDCHSWLSSLRFYLTFICQCLWIVHSWLLLQSRVSKVDSALDCPFLIAPSISCIQSWQCSGLSILDCSFNLVCLKLTVLWIVHSWLLLQCRVPKVESALDCPFLIAPSISCAQSWQCSGLSILDCRPFGFL